MIDITKLSYPITLVTLEREAPDAFQELVRIDTALRNVLLTWLNGQTTSPPDRGHADKEFDKEDAKQSDLKIKHLVESTSERIRSSNYVVHLMTEKQRHDFFNSREAMKRRVKKKVKSEKVERAKADLKRSYKVLGKTFKTELMKLEAANDPLYKKEAE